MKAHQLLHDKDIKQLKGSDKDKANVLQELVTGGVWLAYSKSVKLALLPYLEKVHACLQNDTEAVPDVANLFPDDSYMLNLRSADIIKDIDGYVSAGIKVCEVVKKIKERIVLI